MVCTDVKFLQQKGALVPHFDRKIFLVMHSDVKTVSETFRELNYAKACNLVSIFHAEVVAIFPLHFRIFIYKFK